MISIDSKLLTHNEKENNTKKQGGNNRFIKIKIIHGQILRRCFFR